ncbi:MAG: hypothetical protein EOM67_02500 [Spirochaetia bacterium]|nr:hypothetical protein [Spirochaetia bacterium]
MKSNKTIKTILQNWPAKIFSLLIAIALYLVVTLSLVGSQTIEIPLKIIHPTGYEAVSTLEETVELTLKAQQKYLALINPRAIQAVADFSFVASTGVAVTQVALSYDESLFNIDVSLSTNPERIKVFYQKSEGENPLNDEVSK